MGARVQPLRLGGRVTVLRGYGAHAPEASMWGTLVGVPTCRRTV